MLLAVQPLPKKSEAAPLCLRVAARKGRCTMQGMIDPFALWPLPNASNWSFAQFRASSPAEAEVLEATAGRDELLEAITDALTLALSGAVVIAWEFAEMRNSDHRAVVQFPVSRTVF